jgi:DNA-binding response OmpR family regulator
MNLYQWGVGIKAFLTKPLNMQELAVTVRSVLDKVQTQMQPERN